MKRIFFITICLLSTIITMSQAPKKKPVKEKPPTQKEMEDMMKEIQKEMEGMSAEDKKMLDSMGVKLPSMNSMPKLSDKQWAEAMEEEGRIVPRRDAGRIASIPKPVTNARMGAYISAVHGKVAAALKPEVVSTGNRLYDYIKSNHKNAAEAGNAAMGIWMAGKPELAVYVLGKICASDAGSADNLSNYSAMLSMQGAQHLAIPILDNLNARFPKNSTLLNNLGQAWFGLGELNKAEKYLDSTIRIYAYHPQANLTKSNIEESKGNKQGAIEAAKRSIKKAYSPEKENRLNKLGYKLKPEDLIWGRPMPQDALGLEKFKWPAYPMSVAQSVVLEKEWDVFKQKCGEALDELRQQEKKLEQEAMVANEARTRQLLQAGMNGQRVDPMPPLAAKAIAKLGHLVVDRDGHLAFAYQAKVEAVSNALLESAKFDEILDAQLETLQKQYEDQFGEGKPNPFEAACADDTKAKDRYLSSSNQLLRDAYHDYLAFLRRKINNETYYYQYTSWPEQFELIKVQAKMMWLSAISNQTPKFQNYGATCKDITQHEEKSFKLANFEDFNCQYTSSLNLGCLKMQTNCGQTTTTYGCGQIVFVERESGQNYTGGTLKLSHKIGVGDNIGPLIVEASLGGDVSIELDENNRIKEWEGKATGKLEAGVGIQKGPVKASASAYEAVEIEFGSNGVSDINLIVGAKAEAGIAAPKTGGDDKIDRQINQGIDAVNKGIGKLKTSVEIGVESRTSLISGKGSVSGTGILTGVKMSEW